VRRPPPKIVRRLVIAPLVLLVCLAVLALSGLLLTGALVFDLARRAGRGGTRFAAFALCFAATEAGMLVALFLLWLASGFGLLMQSRRLRSAHYALMRGWLRCLSWAAIRLLGLRIEIVDRAEPRPGPILVFGRHAGAGNSLMMARTLMLAYGRRPRVVMIADLQWDPVIDVMCHRLPSLFIERSERFVEAIGDLARGMDDDEAFVLYPEGHDFTEKLRLRAIAHLRKDGYLAAAEQAEEMARVLPPRHRGPLAAILAAPEADVVMFAHTTLEELGTFRYLYRQLPLARPVKARYWRIPAAEVPHEQEALIPWLFDWWKRIDKWIEEHAPGTPRHPAKGQRAGINYGERS
jgi:1-acyl-sn-glycerol-3-phosphate acyltransferase